MPNEAARRIIERALSSRDAYDKMARREAEVWSRFSDNKRVSEVRAIDAEAAGKLRVNRMKFSFVDWCKSNNRSFENGLSLGCGSGRAERNFIAHKICNKFHGVDIAAESIRAAQAAASEKMLNCTYELADLNFFDFGESKYDLIVAQTSLHHLVHLENVFDRVHTALTPDGVFWVHDYCGESQFQYSDLRLGIANSILACLPEKYRLNRVSGITVNKLIRRAPGTLISPFESIRSGEICPLLEERFDVVEGRVDSAIMHLVCPVGTRQNFCEAEEGQAIFDLLLTLDNILLNANVLTGTEARLVLKKKI